ncbi:MAG TPA: hypothetical protein VGN72_06540 [Tepidisphaeraceae bacterium]|jgi:hypothetical protein|nr:hypothetical protein [Tepidisphaeraceae bacterium]
MAVPQNIERFLRVVTDSKYQFSLGLLATMFGVFPADWRLLVCVTAIGCITIAAEGVRDYAKNRDVPVDGKLAVNVGTNATGTVTQNTTPPADEPYPRVQ